MKSIQRNQGGFSLVEILLVLGIIAILAIAAFIIFPQVQASNRANTEQSNITTLAAGVKNLYGATRDYAGVDAEVVNQARIAPPSMNGGDFAATTLSSSWSGDVEISGSDAAGAAATAAGTRLFRIAYADMPAEVCTRLVPGLSQNFQTVLVGATTVKSATVAPDAGAIVTACQGTGGVVDSVTFVSN